MPVRLERRVETLEDLMTELLRAAAETERQFQRTERQFERTDRQFERTDRQLDRSSREMAAFRESLAEHNARLDALGERIDQSLADSARDRIERRREWANCPGGSERWSRIWSPRACLASCAR